MRIRRFLRYALPASIGLFCIFWLGMLSSGLRQAEAQGEWSIPVAIPDAYGYNDLVVDSQGTVHVVHAKSAWTVYHQSKPLDGQWSSRTRISDDLSGLAPYKPNINVDDEDNLHVVWRESYLVGGESEIWYNGRLAVLGSWGQPEVLSSIDASAFPRIATDSTGVAHMVGVLDPPPFQGSNKLLYCMKPSGGSWVGPGEIPHTSRVSWSNPGVAVGPDDTLHVVFNRDYELSYINKPAGGSWSEPITITHSGLTYFFLRAEVDGTGTIHVVWGDDNLDSLQYVSKSPDMSWTTAISIPNTTSAYPGVDLALDAADNLHIVWANPETGDIHYIARQSTDGQWSDRHTLTTADPDPSRKNMWPHIAIGPNGDLHAIWDKESEGQIYYTSLAAPPVPLIYLPVILKNH